MRRTKNTIPPINGGLACPDPLSLVQTCNNCIISDWSPCNGTNRTRTRTRTQSKNGGMACTPNENALPEIQSCNHCEISDWSPCNGTNRTRTRTQAINSVACTSEQNALPEIQTCNHCIISYLGWCNNTSNLITRIRTQAINGGIACTTEQNALPESHICYIEITPNVPINILSSGKKIIVFNYTSDSPGLTGQTEYTFTYTGNYLNVKILVVGGGGGEVMQVVVVVEMFY
jgi:hypothetical protein